MLTQLSPPRAAVLPESGGRPDLTVNVSRELFEREATRRAGPTLAQYNLREPHWELGDDNTITLSATTTIPLLEMDVNVRVLTQPVVRDGALAVEITQIDYGRISVGGDPLAGLADELNKQLAAAINPQKFQVTGVRTSTDSIELTMQVVGTL